MFGMVVAKRLILRDWKSASPRFTILNDIVSCIYLQEIRYTLSDTHHKFLEVWGPFIEYIWSPELVTLDYIILSHFVLYRLHCALYIQASPWTLLILALWTLSWTLKPTCTLELACGLTCMTFFFFKCLYYCGLVVCLVLCSVYCLAYVCFLCGLILKIFINKVF